MPIFETPYGTVDAPDLGAAQKWIAGQKGSAPAGGMPPAAPTTPPAASPAPAAPQGASEEGVLGRLWQGLQAGFSDQQFESASKIPGGAVGAIGAIPSRMVYRGLEGLGAGLSAPGRVAGGEQPFVGQSREVQTQAAMPTAMLMAGQGWRAPRSMPAAAPAEATPAAGPGAMAGVADMWSQLVSGGGAAISPERMARVAGGPSSQEALVPRAPGGLQDARGTRPTPVGEMPVSPERLARAMQPGQIPERPPVQEDLTNKAFPGTPGYLIGRRMPNLPPPPEPSAMDLLRSPQPSTPIPPSTFASGEALRSAAGVNRPILQRPAARLTMDVPPATPRVEPPASSQLSEAMVSGDGDAIDRALVRDYRRAVQPSKLKRDASLRALDTQDRQIMTAVDQIISSRQLKPGPDGRPAVVGAAQQLPTSIRGFAEGLDEEMRSVFQAYDTKAKAAGEAGVLVDMRPVAEALRQTAARRPIADWHPNIVSNAERIAGNLDIKPYYTPLEAQDLLSDLNSSLKPQYGSVTHETASLARELVPVSRIIRDQLDKAITENQGEGYQALRHRYGALRAVSTDLARAVQRQANKTPGMGDMLIDTLSGEELMRGILFMRPEAVATAVGLRAARNVVKSINDPNRAIARMFRHRADPEARPQMRFIGELPAGREIRSPFVGAVPGGLSLPEQPRRYTPTATGSP